MVENVILLLIILPSLFYRNWCAYVHTRLVPTVVVDNLETFSSGRAKPCTWQIGSCAQRYGEPGRKSACKYFSYNQIHHKCKYNFKN